MRIGVALLLVLLLAPAARRARSPRRRSHVSSFELQSKLLGRAARPRCSSRRRAAARAGRCSSSCTATAARRATRSARPSSRPCAGSATARRWSCCREGEVGWWHDRAEGALGLLRARRGDPGRARAQRRRPAPRRDRRDLDGRLRRARPRPARANRFCAVGGHSPAVFERGNDDISFGFDNAADFARNDLIGIARKRSPYDAPVWIDVGDQDLLRPADALLARELRAARRGRQLPRLAGQPRRRLLGPHFAEYLRFYADACS